jgi:hypothetical protein
MLNQSTKDKIYSVSNQINKMKEPFCRIQQSKTVTSEMKESAGRFLRDIIGEHCALLNLILIAQEEQKKCTNFIPLVYLYRKVKMQKLVAVALKAAEDFMANGEKRRVFLEAYEQ